jgi:hypothetical protein
MSMETPLQWPNATIAWTPDGYVLRVPAWLDARATVLFEESGVFRELPGERIAWQVRAGRRTNSSSGAAFEPGELTITSPSLLTATEPADLKRLLDNAARKARQAAEEAEALDKQRAEAFLAALRGE